MGVWCRSQRVSLKPTVVPMWYRFNVSACDRAGHLSAGTLLGVRVHIGRGVDPEEVAGGHNPDEMTVLFDENVADIALAHLFSHVGHRGCGVAPDKLRGRHVERRGRIQRATGHKRSDEVTFGHDTDGPFVAADHERADVASRQCVRYLQQRGVGVNTGDRVGDDRRREASAPALPGSITTIVVCQDTQAVTVSAADRATVTAETLDESSTFLARLADRGTTRQGNKAHRRDCNNCHAPTRHRMPQKPITTSSSTTSTTSGLKRKTPVAGAAGPKVLPCAGQQAPRRPVESRIAVAAPLEDLSLIHPTSHEDVGVCGKGTVGSTAVQATRTKTASFVT